MLKRNRPILIIFIAASLCCQNDESGETKNLNGIQTNHVISLPERLSDALTGSDLVAVLSSLNLREREGRIKREILEGNIPDFIRNLVPVIVTKTKDGLVDTAIFYATCDYLALGSDADYFLIPMTPILAQELGDSLHMSLPTRKMVNAIWQQGDLKLEPRPIPPSSAMVTIPVFADHNTIVHDQRYQSISTNPLGALVSGHKKDVIISNRILANQDKVVIYGWHRLNGQPIQPLYAGHVNWYADYSHGIRLVERAIDLRNSQEDIRNILTDSLLYSLLSDEDGPMEMPYYPVDKSDYPE